MVFDYFIIQSLTFLKLTFLLNKIGLSENFKIYLNMKILKIHHYFHLKITNQQISKYSRNIIFSSYFLIFSTFYSFWWLQLFLIIHIPNKIFMPSSIQVFIYIKWNKIFLKNHLLLVQGTFNPIKNISFVMLAQDWFFALVFWVWPFS